MLETVWPLGFFQGAFFILPPANTGRNEPNICDLQMLGFFSALNWEHSHEKRLFAGKRPALQVVSTHPKQLEQLGGKQMKIIKITDYYGNIQAVPVDDALYEEWLELKREEDRNEKKEMYSATW